MAALLAGLLMISEPAVSAGVGVSVNAEAASKLGAPKNVKAEADGNDITLTWKKVKGADAYRVYVREPGAASYRTLTTTKKTSVAFKADAAGTYRFRTAALVRTNGSYKTQTKSSAVSVRIKEENMTDRITVNTQSSIRIDADGLIIRIDPYGITGEPHDADIVLITHAHYDHFSPDDISKVSKDGTVFAAPAGMKKELVKEGIASPVLLSPGDTVEIAGIKVETVCAYNSGKMFHPRSNGWLGYIVTVNGKRIYAAGDTDALKELESVKCDVALVPIGGTYTMDYKEAASLVNTIRPEAVIPIHYGSIVGKRSCGDSFAKLVDKDIKVVLKL